MADYFAQKPCPYCGIKQSKRLHRKLWMRLLPGSSYYLCTACHTKYLSFMGFLKLVVG